MDITGRRRAPNGGPRAGAATMEGGAYGAGKAGGAFDPYTLVRQPHTILRVVSWVRMAGWPGWTRGRGPGWGVLAVPWTSRRSSQSILKEINPEYSLEGLMLKRILQYFGHLKIGRAHV